MTGDVTLTVVEPDFLKRLHRAGEKYDEALRIAGIKRRNLDDDRNEADGKVYEARKSFNALLEECRRVGI